MVRPFQEHFNRLSRPFNSVRPADYGNGFPENRYETTAFFLENIPCGAVPADNPALFRYLRALGLSQDVLKRNYFQQEGIVGKGERLFGRKAPGNRSNNIQSII